MEVTQIGASWDVVAGVQTGVDIIPMKHNVIRKLIEAGEFFLQ